MISCWVGERHCSALGRSSFEPVLTHDKTNDSSMLAITLLLTPGVGITYKLLHSTRKKCLKKLLFFFVFFFLEEKANTV